MTDPTADEQQRLDATQYQTDSISHYEAIFGRDFVSPGGIDVARETIARMGLKPGARVLDVGCGIGGAAFVMAREFGLRVVGIDLSQNMLAMARARLADYDLADRVELCWGNCLELDTHEHFDAIYSRDVFLHIADKPRLLTVLYNALRPNGVLLFTDYCCGPKPWDPAFENYVSGRGYDLHRVNEYAGLIAQAGFAAVSGEDLSARFIKLLHSELAVIDGLDLATPEREELRASWRRKIDFARIGNQSWGLFQACKPGTTADQYRTEVIE